MKYYDQHLHTYLSFDSTETFENYLDKGVEIFVSTDHFDLKNPYTDFNDDVPDYDIYCEKLAELESKYKTRLLKGIEIGVVPGQEETIIDFLSQRTYDVKILSIHQNGKIDFMDPIVKTKLKLDVATEYFQQMDRVLESFPEGNILAHFEYGLRQLELSAKELEENFEPLLIKIFKKAITREMGFELNAKSFVNYHNAELYRYAVPLYRSLGGKLFTLGSDAHVAQDYQLGFSEMTALLKENEVKQLVVFQGNERFMTDLPE
ncbi:histidinol-phosphatase (PHP family) [Enterococcus sp. AZ194]|uniref:PHP domain-containing protein n=1 Tax=Enterococcus sp. AZ194 TaxID=2774629 RepID=UPI003F2837D7